MVGYEIGGDGIVTLTISKSEMGQGVRTSLAMILAEELGADWAQIKMVQASPSADSAISGRAAAGVMEDGWRRCGRQPRPRARCSSARRQARWKVAR